MWYHEDYGTQCLDQNHDFSFFYHSNFFTLFYFSVFFSNFCSILKSFLGSIIFYENAHSTWILLPAWIEFFSLLIPWHVYLISLTDIIFSSSLFFVWHFSFSLIFLSLSFLRKVSLQVEKILLLLKWKRWRVKVSVWVSGTEESKRWRWWSLIRMKRDREGEMNQGMEWL